jgi:N utilization substance protein B
VTQPPAGRRRGAARLAAVQALYEMEMTGVAPDPVLAEFLDHRWPQEEEGRALVPPYRGMLGRIVRGVAERREDLDPMVAGALAAGHPLERLEVLLAGILRAGTYELLAEPEVPARVVINEYVDVARAFYDGGEPGMVNAVLDRLARTLRQMEMEADPGAETG